MKTNQFAFFSALLWFSFALSPLLAREPEPSAGLEAAEPADAEAQYQLGKACLHGNGCAKDPAKALELMTKAASQGHAEALGAVGYFYSSGVVVQKDQKEALVWFRKGADKGGAKAQLNLGLMLANGNGTTKQEAEGQQWIQRAGAQKLPEAMHVLGEIFYLGRFGCKVDSKEALRWFLLAAEAGNAEAQNMAGVLLREGSGTPTDLVAAQSWFQKSAEQGNAKGQSNYGHLLGPESRDVNQRIQALKWLILAQRQNEITATQTLNELRAHLSQDDISKAMKLIAEMPADISPVPGK